MPPARLLRGGGHVARLRTWPGDASTAQLLTVDASSPPPVAVIRSWVEEIRRDGFRRVRTGAISELRTAPYDALGFATIQRLTLLHLDLVAPRPAVQIGDVALRKAAGDEFGRLALLDAAAFPAGWNLDPGAIGDAAAATPRSRIRVVDAADGGRPIGYAVNGRAGRAAFLQRLAVDPAAQRRGIGAALVADGISWARRWRCRSMAVNTQDDNVTARLLYQRAGFVARPHGLVVLQIDVEPER